MNQKVADAVIARSGGVCEAGLGGRRCPHKAEHIHHKLPKSRGGRLLDDAAATAAKAGSFDPAAHLYHLAHLCARCHTLAHGNPQYGRSIGTVIPGQVRTGLSGRPEYVGSHPKMADLWPLGDVG